VTLELVAAEPRGAELLGLTVLVLPGGAVGVEPLLRESDGPAD